MVAPSFRVLFCVIFKIFYAILQKMLYIDTSTSKILAAGFERTTTGLYFMTLHYPPLPASL